MRGNGWLVLMAAIAGVFFMIRKTWAIPEAGKPYAALFEFVEKNYGLPKNLLARMAQQESSYNPKAVSPVGAQGLMQIVPRWHPTVDPFNTPEAISYAGRFIAANYKQFGSWALALAAYNWGPGNVARNRNPAAWPDETKNYVAKIGGDIDDTVKWA
jgi:soluble lytic murein transglycosylase-like protein